VPVEIRSAATVVLLRDGEAGIETFVMRRATTMAFAPRMHVFPGGRVDEIDSREQVHFLSGDVDAMAARASTDVDGVRALYSCAVRETAEEAGIAISSRDDEGRLLIDPTLLPIIDHWVTPETESHRYDVRFFAAVVADGQASLTTTEADVAAWIAPADALMDFAAGRMAMLPPTESVLRWLAEFDRAEDVIADAPSRLVRPLLPKRFVEADGRVHWAMVNDRTGEILVDEITMPHTREVDGLPTGSQS
jgi:8-oxo-dGTP pyrophosphatase MutT (NUDIX family)